MSSTKNRGYKTRGEAIKTKEWARCDKCARAYEEDDGMLKCVLNDLTPMQNPECENYIHDTGGFVRDSIYFCKR
jgi:hypothetical protein